MSSRPQTTDRAIEDRTSHTSWNPEPQYQVREAQSPATRTATQLWKEPRRRLRVLPSKVHSSNEGESIWHTASTPRTLPERRGTNVRHEKVFNYELQALQTGIRTWELRYAHGLVRRTERLTNTTAEPKIPKCSSKLREHRHHATLAHPGIHLHHTAEERRYSNEQTCFGYTVQGPGTRSESGTERPDASKDEWTSVGRTSWTRPSTNAQE